MQGNIMSKVTIQAVLENAKTTKMKELPIIVKALRFYGVITPIKFNMTASDLLHHLKINDPDVLHLTVKELIDPRSPNDNKCNTVKILLMWFMLVIMAGAYAFSNIYISITTMQAISWEDMLLPLIGPILLVLHERGVMSRENREVLSAISGVHPALTFIESVSQRIANGPANKVVPVKEDEPVKKVNDY